MLHRRHALLFALTLALTPLALAHPGGLPGAPKPWCEATAADRNVHEYAARTDGRMVPFAFDSAVGDCDGNGIPEDEGDGHLEFAFAGSFLLVADPGAQDCWLDVADHPQHPLVTVTDDVLASVRFTVHADTLDNIPRINPSEPYCGDGDVDRVQTCTDSCAIAIPPGMDGSYAILIDGVSGHVTTAVGTIACSDGVDNDGDGHVDHPADLGCASPGDPTE